VAEQLDRIAAGELLYGQRYAYLSIQRVVAFPFQEGGTCPRLLPGTDPVMVMERIFQYASDHDDDEIAGSVLHFAAMRAYRDVDKLGWSPTELLFEIVATGRNEGARGMALHRLAELADDPSIRTRLLAMARAPEGPPGWPELPVALAQMMGPLPSPANRPLFEELRANPHLIRNPVARWGWECAAYDKVPLEADHPCHPSKAPPRPSGG